MRKCYIMDMGREKSAYWEKFLGSSNPDKAFDFAYNKYVPKFDRFIPLGAKILEGGCGLGQYVYYYSEKDFSVQGVDFSDRLIEKARTLNPKAKFETTDIRNLPFADNSFDVYILNGVLEHFEEGPREALKEAGRVLAKDGILIVTLQYINFARTLADWACSVQGFFKAGLNREKMRNYRGANIKGSYKLVKEFLVEESPYFHSYFFSKKEALDIFRKFNFKITYVRVLSVENGLGDFRFFRLLYQPLNASGNNTTQRKEKPRDKNGCSNPVRRWIKKTFIQEEPQEPIGLILLRVLQCFFGSMILIVCRKK